MFIQQLQTTGVFISDTEDAILEQVKRKMASIL